MWWIFLIGSLWVSGAHSPQSVIDEARALVLKKNRVQACELLNRALSETPTPVRGRRQLLDSLQRLSRVFLTDKGQKLYEAGQVITLENPELAINQLKESLELENENVLVLSALTRAYLARQDCDSALAAIERARNVNPWFAEAAVLELRSLYCMKNYSAMRNKMKSLPPLSPPEERFVRYLLAKDYGRQRLTKKSFEVLSKLANENVDFPEVYLALGRAAKELKKDSDSWLNKYVTLCKNLSPRDRRKFYYEPQVCTSLKEVENELDKNLEL